MSATSSLLRPRGRVALRVRRPSLSTQVDLRVVAVCAGLVTVIAVAFAVSVSVGDFPIPLVDVVPAIFGYGDPDADFIVRTLRLPRALTGLLVGAAFGLSGAIFQSLARNPLASPDVIGVTAGAGVVAVAMIVLVGAASSLTISLGAFAGALATAVTVYLLAYKRGITGYRLILVGIGVTAVLASLTEWLLTRAEIYDAARATVWLTGSLNGRGWEHVRPVGAALLTLLPVTLALARPLRALQMGDDTARGLGVRVEPAKLGLVVTGVGLAALATASAGPVAFVALVAPQIARRLTNGTGVSMVAAALTGAALVLLSDLVATQAFAPVQLPVGVVTAVVGAPYLLWLLARANRIGRGG
ncbi:MAG: iron chelate uptake ABC transporter family permease subunit [Actinobacteria bacterium]|nr:iron chelate uptake ABC transporter family permease subunit [Actinomycetota bacterium]